MNENHEGHAHHHHHPPITGEAGELVDLFMDLIDREPERDPHWWHTYGQMVLFRFSRGFFTQSMDRATAMGALREILMEAITDGGIMENFLIRSLKRDLDDWVRDRTDNLDLQQEGRSGTSRHGEDCRGHAGARPVAGVIGKRESEVRDVDRRATHRGRGAHDRNSPITRHVSADDAANRWADAEEWQGLGEAVLPDVVFDHWQHLNIKREQKRGL